MERDDFSKDDFLGRLIQKMPLESPSEDFVTRIMAGIETVPETVPEKKSIFRYLNSIIPYTLLIFLLLVVFSTSDLPFTNWMPGKDYYLNYLLPYFGTLISGLKNAFASKYVSFGLLIAVSTGLLFLVDRLFSRRSWT